MRKRRIGNRVAKAEPSAGVFRVAEDCTGTSVACVQGVKCSCDSGTAENVCMTLADVQANGGTIIQKVNGVCYTFDEANEVACKECGFVASPSNFYANCTACCTDEPPECCDTTCGFGLDAQKCYNSPDGGGNVYAIWSYQIDGQYRECCTASGTPTVTSCTPVSISDSGLFVFPGVSAGCGDLSEQLSPAQNAVWSVAFTCCANQDEDSTSVRLGASAQTCTPSGPNAGAPRIVLRWSNTGLGVVFNVLTDTGDGQCQNATRTGTLSLGAATCNGVPYTRIEGTWSQSVQILNRYACPGSSLLASGSVEELPEDIAAQLPPELHGAARAALASRRGPRPFSSTSSTSSGCSGCGKGEEGVVFQ